MTQLIVMVKHSAAGVLDSQRGACETAARVVSILVRHNAVGMLHNVVASSSQLYLLLVVMHGCVLCHSMTTASQPAQK